MRTCRRDLVNQGVGVCGCSGCGRRPRILPVFDRPRLSGSGAAFCKSSEYASAPLWSIPRAAGRRRQAVVGPGRRRSGEGLAPWKPPPCLGFHARGPRDGGCCIRAAAGAVEECRSQNIHPVLSVIPTTATTATTAIISAAALHIYTVTRCFTSVIVRSIRLFELLWDRYDTIRIEK